MGEEEKSRYCRRTAATPLALTHLMLSGKRTHRVYRVFPIEKMERVDEIGQLGTTNQQNFPIVG